MSELVDAVTRYTKRQTGASPFRTAIDGLTILRSDHETRPTHLIFKPALCIVVQGAKRGIVGDRRIDYGAGQALVVSIEMPILSRVVEASPSEPYLGIIIEFDLAIMREVYGALTAPPRPDGQAGAAAGIFVTDFGGPLADCTLRMVRLLGAPDAIPVLYPAIMREICYWLLAGPQGGEVARLVLAKSHEQRIIRAIHALRARFTKPVRVEELAAVARMSSSAFHRQFKAVTSMTPLQYQKQLRLLEARRLMVDGANVETAAYRVGYDSASQFSREYARLFGAPPRRDVVGVRGVAA